jgi:copper ion binding protein
MTHLKLKIQGMSCGHCVAAVERALGRINGVENKQVQVGSAEIDYDPQRTDTDRITAAIRDAGYQPEVAL